MTEWARDRSFELEGKTATVQGFGNVGSNAALLLNKLGVSTIAVGDHSGYLYNPEGFNPHKLQDYVKKTGSIAGYPAGKAITRGLTDNDDWGGGGGGFGGGFGGGGGGGFGGFGGGMSGGGGASGGW